MKNRTMSTITKHEIAKMIDHSLLHPTMDDRTLIEGIELAKNYRLSEKDLSVNYVTTSVKPAS